MAKEKESTEGGMKPDNTAGQDVKDAGHLKELMDDNYAEMSDTMAKEQKQADDER
jgi:hypothetical protein